MCFKKIQKVIEKNENKIRTWAALVFLVASIALVIVLYSSVISSLETVGYVIPEPRNVTIPLHMNLNGTRSYDVDVSFTFDFTYHNGTLIVDEPVDMDGVAVFASKNAKEIETIQVGFQNAIAYNKTERTIIRDYYGIPQHGYLFFNSSQSGIIYPFSLTENITVIWTIDGSYHPIIGFKYKNGTQIPPMLIEDVAITVFPREQVTQAQTAEVNTRLSFVNTQLAIAVFAISIFNIISIVFDILPSRNVCNYPIPEETTQESQESQQRLQNKKQGRPQWEI